MRTSHYLIATKREAPAGAVVISHQLMLRAGLVRKLASGLYTWLPLGTRILRKVEAIIREEMDKTGAQEVIMPIVQNAELWQESGRWDEYGPELLRLNDRHNREFVLGPTHEEVITDLVRDEVGSYKQLPLNLYQIQTKFRDEIRPRFGVMRGREFTMKDAYSFHLDADSLQDEYQVMYKTYCAIFDRLGLTYRAVEADTGSIGGSASHEFHVLAASGEDAIAFSDSSEYAANIEKAEALSVINERNKPEETLSIFETPNTKTIADLVNKFGIPIEKTVKTLIVKAEESQKSNYIALLIRGDHTLNEIKADHLAEVASPLQFASEEEIRKEVGAGPGSLGPVNLPFPCIVDRTVAMMSDFSAGANIEEKHYLGINWDRDAHFLQSYDLREIVEGDESPDGKGKLFIKRGIEVGHIFQLGQKYSQAMNATVLDPEGKSQVLQMGCYGLGVTRVIAAAIEQNYDDRGIIWPQSMAPFQVALVGLKIEKSVEVKKVTDSLYQQLVEKGVDVLVDDRKASPGVKLADMDLIGIPHRLVISERGLKTGVLEYKNRSLTEAEEVKLEDATQFLLERL